MNDDNNISLHNDSFALLCLFLFVIPFLMVLNLPRFELKLFDLVGLGALLLYIFSIGIFLIKWRPIFPPEGITIFLVLIVLQLSIKYIISGSFLDYFKHAQAYILAYIFYFIGRKYINTEKRRNNIVLFFISSMVCLALFGIAHFYLFPHIVITDTTGYDMRRGEGVGMLIVEEALRYRESGTIPSPVGFAHILSFAIIFLVSCFNSKMRWVFIGILLYAIVLSGSRSSLYYSLFFLAFTTFKIKKSIIVKLMAVILITFIIIYVSLTYQYLDIRNIYDTGIYLRLLKFYVAKEFFLENISTFLFGVPLEVYPTLESIPNLEVESTVTIGDNSYLYILCETGILGALIVFFLVRTVYLQFRGLKGIQFESFTSRYIRAVKYIGIAFLVYGTANMIHRNFPQMLYMFLFIGSIYSIATTTKFKKRGHSCFLKSAVNRQVYKTKYV